jgi:hypothetical protein
VLQSIMAMAQPAFRWLILVHQLPPRPASLRVRVWRRLQQVGAVVLRNSLYVLPASRETREDFDWVRQEIMTSGGQVSVFEAAAVDGITDDELVLQFRKLRTAEYEDLAGEIRKIAAGAARSKRRTSPTDRQRWLQTVRERFGAIQARDYFGAAGRALVEQALKEVDDSGPPPAGEGARVGTLHPADFRRRTWVTRPRPGVDRFACAWLIRRFIATDAKFAFQDDLASLRKGQIPFDMPDVEFGHHGDSCSLETLMERFGVSDGGVLALSKVVHDLDLKESRYAMAEVPAVGRLVDGLRASYGNDAELLEQGIVVMEALYRSFSSDNGVRRKKAR